MIRQEEHPAFDSQLEALLDEALSPEAMAQDIPADLQDKVLHLSSYARELETALSPAALAEQPSSDLVQAIVELSRDHALLDEALDADHLAEPVPADLAQNIMARSTPLLAMRRSAPAMAEASAVAHAGGVDAESVSAGAEAGSKQAVAGGERAAPQGLEGWLHRTVGARRLRFIRQMAAAVILAAEAGIWFNLIVIADDARAIVNIQTDLAELADNTNVIDPASDPFNDELERLRQQLLGRPATSATDWGEEPPTLEQVLDRSDRDLHMQIPRQLQPLPVLDYGAMDIENYPH